MAKAGIRGFLSLERLPEKQRVGVGSRLSVPEKVPLVYVGYEEAVVTFVNK